MGALLSAGYAYVAPHAGAWIETLRGTVRASKIASPPTRGRGSKHRFQLIRVGAVDVAPHAGAWIETDELRDWAMTSQVAPHAGAWIETLSD